MINQNKMETTQLTAVEWLVKKIYNGEPLDDKLIDQALEREKKQYLNITEHDLDELAISYSMENVSKKYPGFVMQPWEREAVENFKAGFQKALELVTFKSE